MMYKNKSRLRQVLEEFERSLISNTLREQDWSRKKSAQELGIPISTLKYKMSKLGIYKAVPGRKSLSLKDP